jgi:hypothetical protein
MIVTGKTLLHHFVYLWRPPRNNEQFPSHSPRFNASLHEEERPPQALCLGRQL